LPELFELARRALNVEVFGELAGRSVAAFPAVAGEIEHLTREALDLLECRAFRDRRLAVFRL